MSRVEILTPLRIETRFLPDGGAGWTLKLRIYPDDVSLGRPQPLPTKEELDVLEDCLKAAQGAEDPEVAAALAYRAAAAGLGARRAWWLWRNATVPDAAVPGVQRKVDRDLESDPELKLGKPVGLPASLDAWLLFADGSRRLAAGLAPDMAQILFDLDAEQINSATARLPALWWIDYDRALEVGLATEIALTESEANAIDALVVVGTGDSPAAGLLAQHSASGRLSLLNQGSATNTVAGEPTSPGGDEPETWLGLLDSGADTQPGASAILGALGVPPAKLPDQLPIPNGGLDPLSPGQLAVTGLWPVLWGRTFRNVIGTMSEPALAGWARHHLAVQGPLAAIRVGEQPYGLLPASVFAKWTADPSDTDEAAIEASLLGWTLPWRAGAAGEVAAATPVANSAPVVGAGTEQLLALYGRHAPSAWWRVRPVLDLPQLQARQVQQGLPISLLTDYDKSAAAAFHGYPFPVGPIAAAGSRRHIPGPPRDAREDVTALFNMIHEHPESLYSNGERRLGLLGHLMREALIIARAEVGRAFQDLNATRPIDLNAPIPMDGDFANTVAQGTDAVLPVLEIASSEGKLVVHRLREVQRALERLVKLYDNEPETVLRAVKAALDSASFRVDPWMMGIAGRRLERMAAGGAQCLLGAYGWVDAPRPWQAGQPDVLAPGPTEAGLLHAPSFAQAQAAALLRDAALRNAGDGRWDIALGSDKVRDAIALSERVRLGVHPFEALGLEVEAAAGNPDVVRTLRKTFPTVGDDGSGTATPNDPTRRVCDGLAVLDAARAGTLPPGLPADFAQSLEPLDQVLDTYADLLLVDGVHALVTRSPEAGSAAMEAAAGLGSPPGLWGIRTPREARTVSVSCWLVLPPGKGSDADTEPAALADPAFAAFVPDASLDDPRDPELLRASELLGGTEPPHVPASPDGSISEMEKLASAMAQNLKDRLAKLIDRAEAAEATLDDPPDAPALERIETQWNLNLHAEADNWTHADRVGQAKSVLGERIEAATAGKTAPAAGLQEAIRTLVGRPFLPVLPIVDESLLPNWQSVGAPGLDQRWLEIVAAVRPQLAMLEAHQLGAEEPWPSKLDAPGGEPWSPSGPVRVAYGPGLISAGTKVAVTVLDAWADSVPSRRHVTQAAFGFNAPKTRAPQAVLLAVPPDISVPLAGEDLLDLILEVREGALARAARPTDRAGLPFATPSPIVQLEQPADFLEGWH